MPAQESGSVVSFKQWLKEHGGSFHANAIYTEGASGCGVVAEEDISAGEEIVSCPFSLAITKTLSQNALRYILDLTDITWSERQWISVYICMHWILGKYNKFSSHLTHFGYLETLPPTNKLLTALYFNPPEIEKFKGTNLYGATLDRLAQLRVEWNKCQERIAKKSDTWGTLFTWEMYLAAATYLSSRAFPSSILSHTPTLQASDSTEPILFPGIDSLNHARGQPVSWIVTFPKATDAETSVPKISLVLHTHTLTGRELFNNYGPKPNAELILGYGFSLPHNSDDTIILKVGGINGRKWEIGRDANGADGLWEEILATVSSDSEPSALYEIILDTASVLREMVELFMKQLPGLDDINQDPNIRPQVVAMLQDYVEGQRAILDSLLNFARKQEQYAVDLAHADGIGLVLEDMKAAGL